MWDAVSAWTLYLNDRDEPITGWLAEYWLVVSNHARNLVRRYKLVAFSPGTRTAAYDFEVEYVH